MTVDVPAGRHKIGFTVAYELNGRVLRDHRTVDVRGIVSGDVATFELVPSCWSIDGADRWWVDVNVGDTTYGPGVVVETLRLAAWVPGAWRARRPQRPDVLLATPLTPVVIADRPAMTGSSWRFVSDTSGCVGPVPTLRIEFGLGCGPP